MGAGAFNRFARFITDPRVQLALSDDRTTRLAELRRMKARNIIHAAFAVCLFISDLLPVRDPIQPRPRS